MIALLFLLGLIFVGFGYSLKYLDISMDEHDTDTPLLPLEPMEEDQ